MENFNGFHISKKVSRLDAKCFYSKKFLAIYVGRLVT